MTYPIEPPVFYRQIKSFIKRGRAFSKNEQVLYEELYSTFGLPLDCQWNFEEIFQGSDNNIILEIGFGVGTTLLQDANVHPENNYIGVEVYKTGLFNLLKHIFSNHIKNLKVCEGDVNTILKNCIKDKSLAQVQIYFPDPWPKTRHHKRRLIQEDFISILSTKIRKGGTIHLATDWADYATQMQEVLAKNHHYSSKVPDKRFLSKFEQRGIAAGREIFDLKYQVIT